MLKIRRPLGRLIFNMGIAIPGKTVFLIETAPWVFFMQPHLFQIDVKMACMANILNRLICVKFISMLSMYVQFGTHRHFHWRIIVVLTQNPTVLMFVDITGAPKLLQKYVETGVFVGVSEQWPLGEKNPGFMLLLNYIWLYPHSICFHFMVSRISYFS